MLQNQEEGAMDWVHNMTKVEKIGMYLCSRASPHLHIAHIYIAVDTMTDTMTARTKNISINVEPRFLLSPDVSEFRILV